MSVQTNRSFFVLSAIASAVVIAALVVTPAAGQTKPTNKPGAVTKPAPPTTRVLPTDPNLPRAVVNSWALSPTGAKAGEPGTRPNLSYELAAGAQVKDSVTLFNYSNVQLTFRIYGTDAFNNVDGQFDLLTGDQAPVDAGAWVTLPQENITVPALASASLPITVAVPPDARPGDHGAAVLAASQAEGTGPDGKIITLDRRTGSRLYIRVAGPLDPGLDVSRYHGTYHPALNPLRGSLDVTYTVRNRGNVRLAAKQRLALRAVAGLGLDQSTPVDLPELLPGNSVTLHATFEGVPATVLLLTRISLIPIGAKDAVNPDVKATSRTGRTLAVPWTLVALMLTTGLGLYARKAYSRHQDAETVGGATGPAGAPMP